MLRRLIAGLALVLWFALGVDANVACDICVSSVIAAGGTGTCTGTPWTDSFDVIERTYSAGDIVCVADDHAESVGTVTITGSAAEGANDPAMIICVDQSTCTAGSCEVCGDGERASVTAPGAGHLFIQGKIWIYGVYFYVGNETWLGTSGDAQIYIEQGRIELTTDSSSDDINIGGSSALAHEINLVNTDIDFANAGQGFGLTGCLFSWSGGTLEFNVTNLIKSLSLRKASATFMGLDLSILSNSILQASVPTGITVDIARSELHANVSVLNGTFDTPDAFIRILNSSSDTSSNPESAFEEYQYQGEIVLSLTDYLDDADDGATDGTNKYSWEFDTFQGSNVLEIYEPLCSKTPIATWVAGGSSVTATIYASGPSGKNTDDAWINWEHRSTDSSDSAQSEFTSLRADPGDDSTGLTSDDVHGGDWTNGGATKYKFVHTATYDKDGVLYAWSCVAYLTGDGTNTFFINPKIVR